MPTLKFRFNTECQVTLSGATYEEAYLQFKDFMHGEAALDTARLEVFPPEEPMIFFEVDEQPEFATIDHFKGDFVKDIVEHCPADLRSRVDHLRFPGARSMS